MNAQEHYAQAERHLAEAAHFAARTADADVLEDPDALADYRHSTMAALAGAQVHATLAVAAGLQGERWIPC